MHAWAVKLNFRAAGPLNRNTMFCTFFDHIVSEKHTYAMHMEQSAPADGQSRLGNGPVEADLMSYMTKNQHSTLS